MRTGKTIITVLAAVLALVILAVASGCEGANNVSGGTKKPSTSAPTPEPVTVTPQNELDEMLVPFWLMDTMYNEATCMIERDEGPATAKLLFVPTEIVSVRDYSLNTTYVEGVDYTWERGTNELVLTANSAIPFFTKEFLAGIGEDGVPFKDFPGTNTLDSLGRGRVGNALICVNELYYGKRLAVTYKYQAGSWGGNPVTDYQGNLLPRTVAKLKDGEKMNVVFFGDSIFEGCDSSSRNGHPPMQLSFDRLIKKYLVERFGVKINLRNPSKGGMPSTWGAENTRLITNSKTLPDLAVIGFGMNDTNESVTASSVAKIVEEIKAAAPECEFILVAPIKPNPASGLLTCQSRIPDALRELAGVDGVAFVDMYDFHEALLENKDYAAMAGNNVNHPNDWLIRVYAMNILSTFVEF